MSHSQIAILGGTMISISGENIEKSSKYAYLFNFNGNKRVDRTNDLESPIHSTRIIMIMPFISESWEEQREFLI